MSKRFSFLKDDEALEEIRKHKWIESEKAGREIGFASAAVEWVNNHGESWYRHQRKTGSHRRRFFNKAKEMFRHTHS